MSFPLKPCSECSSTFVLPDLPSTWGDDVPYWNCIDCGHRFLWYRDVDLEGEG